MEPQATNITATNGHHAGPGHDDHDDDTSLLVLYGSETGNAQDVAERIAAETIQNGLRTRLMAMDAYPLVNYDPEGPLLKILTNLSKG